MPVYDDERVGTNKAGSDSSGPSIRPNLNVAEGKSESLQAREQNAGKGPGSAAGMAGAASKASDVVGKGFSPELQTAKQAVKLAKSLKDALWGSQDRKRNTVIGGVGGTAVTGLFIMFLLFIPNEVISLISQTDGRFMSTSESEMDRETQNVTKWGVEDGLEDWAGAGCAGPISFARCLFKKAFPKDPDPVEEAYEAWAKNGLVDQFADQGITFEKEAGRIIMKSDALPDGSIDVTDFATGTGDLPDAASSVLNDAIERIEVPDGAWIHGEPGSVDSLLDLMKSLFGQKTKFDTLCDDPGNCADEENQEQQELAKDSNPEAEADAVDQIAVDTPTDADAAAAAICMLNAQCVPQAKPAPDPGESAETDPSAGNETDFQREAATDMDNAEAAEEGEDLGEVAEAAEAEGAEGSEGLVDSILAAMLNSVGVDATAATAKEVLSQTFSKVAGPVGWVLGAASVLQLLHDAGPKVRTLDAAILAAMTVKSYLLYHTTGDEQKSGNGNLDLDGSINSSIDGGTSSPAYSYFLDPNNTTQTASTTHSYLDSRNMAFGDSNNSIEEFSDAWNKTPGTGPISSLAGHVSNSVNYYIGPVVGFILNLPGIKQVVNHLVGLIAPLLIDFMIKYVLQLPPKFASAISEDKVSSIIVGGDKTGEEADESIGGEEVSPTAMAKIVNEDQEVAVQQFQQQPLFARIFSTTTPYSLVMRLSIAMPSGFASGVQTTFASLLSDPFGKIASGFSTLLSPGHVFAAAAPQADPAGIPDIAIPDNDPVFTSDPEKYWQQHDCSQQEAQDYPLWHQSFVQYAPDGKTATNYDEWVPTTVNGCLLIQRASAAGSLLFGGTAE